MVRGQKKIKGSTHTNPKMEKVPKKKKVAWHPSTRGLKLKVRGEDKR